MQFIQLIVTSCESGTGGWLANRHTEGTKLDFNLRLHTFHPEIPTHDTACTIYEAFSYHQIIWVKGQGKCIIVQSITQTGRCVRNKYVWVSACVCEI